MVEQTTDTGTLRYELITRDGCGEYEVLGPGSNGIVRVEKITEARPDTGGVVGFNGVLAMALHTLPVAASRRIECIGDSIMCGAHSERGGVFNASCADEHRGSRESSWTSWCPVLARKLDADYVMECCSGNGLVFTDNPLSVLACDWEAVPPVCPVMPKSWQQRLMCSEPGVFVKPSSVCSWVSGAQDPVDFSFAPHAVVINLGQNDFGTTPKHMPSSMLWTTAYTAFVRNISASYAAQAVDPVFFLACGGMDTRYCNATAAAVSSMQEEGMPVHFLDIRAAGAAAWINGSTEGCPGTPGSHPSVESHALMAKAAEPAVRAALGW
jgi:hypothetical protein